MSKCSPELTEWVRKEAARIKSDGCTKVPDFYKDCCLLHDICYHFAKDPFKAYALYEAGEVNYWHLAPSIDQAKADTYLKDCIREKAWCGRLSPMALWRYHVLRRLGKKAWNSHTNTHIV